MKIRKLVLALPFLFAACGVKGNPQPPMEPPVLGRGEPNFSKATEDLKIKKLKKKKSEELDPSWDETQDFSEKPNRLESSDRVKRLSVEERRALARRACSLMDEPADGLAILLPSGNKDIDFIWDFYNSDGSTAEMCGNAARCATRFYFDQIKAANAFRFGTLSGVIDSQMLDPDTAKVQMTKAGSAQKISILGISGLRVDTGVPHFVILQKRDSVLAAKLRSAPEFGAKGTNVTFIESWEQNRVSAVSFERGVEDFTAACGTGAVAAAIFWKKELKARDFEGNSVNVIMPGGELLVENPDENQRSYLTGSAVYLSPCEEREL